MTIGTEARDADADDVAPASLVDALLVYAEPLASGARAIIVGNAESSIADRLLDLGVRGVHVFDPDPTRAANAARSAPRGVTVRALASELDVRDGAFDLALVPDVAELDAPRSTIARLRRALAPSGAVVAMGRARLPEGTEEEVAPFPSALGPAALGYDELYDLFAVEFADVALVGVVPFQGVVFAQLGSDDEAPAVSVDTRFASAPAPSVFVVVASDTDHRADLADRAQLDPYAIVQLPEEPRAIPHETTGALESAVAAAQLKAELLAIQLDEARERLAVADARTIEAATRLERASTERDAALTRAMELETVLAASQQTMATVERRLLEAEQQMLERDDRIAVLSAELDSRRSAEALLADKAAEDNAAEEKAAEAEIEALVARAERVEAALAKSDADLAHMSEVHAAETAAYEEQLTGRARMIAALEKELVRREQLVKELVTSLEESREGTNGVVFEAAAPMSAPAPRPEPALEEEVARLRQKLDELASEVARREGELTARAWHITELENERTRLIERKSETKRPEGRKATASEGDPEVALARLRDELDALRQALAQEHAARVAAESGEELARARSELARQAVLLEQLRGRAESS
jgi:hypothetical protein